MLWRGYFIPIAPAVLLHQHECSGLTMSGRALAHHADLPGKKNIKNINGHVRLDLAFSGGGELGELPAGILNN